MKVLIVDDNGSTREVLRAILKNLGHEVAGEAEDGKSALKAFMELRPEAVLLDIIMPGIDGFEVLRQLRSFSQMPVITFSASADNHTEAIKLGANDFVAKPFQPDFIIKRIEALLGSDDHPAS